jgi:hypothetical protein
MNKNSTSILLSIQETNKIYVLEPKPNEIRKHRNGIMYRVITLTNTNSKNPKYPLTVVYQTVSNGNLWSRPLSDWQRSMTFIEVPVTTVNY